MMPATFRSGETFFARLHSATPLKVDCAVIDVQMPEMNGLEVQERLAKEGHPVPVILITAHDSAEALERAMSRGAFAFLRKPVSRELLLRTLESALGRTSTGDEGES